MSDSWRDGLQFFDPKQDHTVAYKRLPHWAQAGAVSFITWRTADSLPSAAIGRLNRQRQERLKQYHVDATGDWKPAFAKLPLAVRTQLHWSSFAEWDDELDRALGACVLREPELSEIVMNSLLHFDNDRYFLTDAVVMPNHVHLLAAFRDEESLITQCTSWKRFTAKQINRWLKSRNLGHGMTELRGVTDDGEFWQVEQFDHLVRGPEEFDRYRRYIALNPERARLATGSYRYFTKAL